MSYRAEQMVTRAFKGNMHLMTPDPVDYGFIWDGAGNHQLAYELATGTHILRGRPPVFGVSLVHRDRKTRKLEINTFWSYMFDSKDEALAYIQALQCMYRGFDPFV